MNVTPISGALGAEIRGLDVTDLDDETVSDLRDLVIEHEVVIIPGACLTEDDHETFAHRLGAPVTFPLFALLGTTEPTMTVIEDGPDSAPEADQWHTDVTWIAEPPDFAVLSAEVVPERGGDTLWASMTSAYDALSPPMQELCAGLTVRHDNEGFIDGLYRKAPDWAADNDLRKRLTAAYPPVDHPLVRTHPESGRRALFMGGYFMKRVNELTEPESSALLDLLTRHTADARFHCRWRWHPGDLAIWDERSTNHRSAADHFPQRRVIRRCEVGGASPYFDSGA